MTRREEIIWAAGLFEGEGCISYRGLTTCLGLSLAMRDRDVVQRFHDIAGVGTLSGWQPDPPRRYMYQWYVAGEKAALFLEELLPFLGERRTAKAQEMLQARVDHIAAVAGPRTCETCKESFTPAYVGGHSTRRFCSVRCRMDAYNVRKAASRDRKRITA